MYNTVISIEVQWDLCIVLPFPLWMLYHLWAVLTGQNSRSLPNQLQCSHRTSQSCTSSNTVNYIIKVTTVGLEMLACVKFSWSRVVSNCKNIAQNKCHVCRRIHSSVHTHICSSVHTHICICLASDHFHTHTIKQNVVEKVGVYPSLPYI